MISKQQSARSPRLTAPGFTVAMLVGVGYLLPFVALTSGDGADSTASPPNSPSPVAGAARAGAPAERARTLAAATPVGRAAPCEGSAAPPERGEHRHRRDLILRQE
jgi:hypothetical protein